ncbi:MAG: YesL family protein [Lachnospiraceae bacterium]|jgi:uncharacterized membrane protein YesL|nr:YesL family protein [Lachnospiraceae bacterium]
MLNKALNFMTKASNIVILNLLWVLCSIPIFTIGASTTALYTVMLKLVKDEEGYIAKDFFEAFKGNFKQSTILWLIALAVAFVLFLDFRFFGTSNMVVIKMLQYIVTVITLIIAMILGYIFPMVAKFENTLQNYIKNSFYLVIIKLPTSIILLIFNVAPLILTLWNIYTIVTGGLVYLVFGVALVAFINAHFLNKVFDTLS